MGGVVRMVDYKRMYWEDLKRFGSSVILIDIDNPGWIKEIALEEMERKELLVVNKYIEHSSNDYGREGLVNVYDIQERATDNKGNLILFVKNDSIGYQR